VKIVARRTDTEDSFLVDVDGMAGFYNRLHDTLYVSSHSVDSAMSRGYWEPAEGEVPATVNVTRASLPESSVDETGALLEGEKSP